MHHVLLESRGAPWFIGGTLFSVLMTGFWFSGTLTGEVVPRGYDSGLQVMGQQLMFALLPTYLIVSGIFATRYSLRLANDIDQSLAQPVIRTRIGGIEGRAILAGAVLGAAYALVFNIPWSHWAGVAAGDPGYAAVGLGNLIVWIVVGGTLAIRFSVAAAFSVGGEAVAIDLYDPGRLRIFARNGMVDVLLVCGAMSLTVLQSIDAQFRWVNYVFALPVALLAITISMLLPVYPIHRRIVMMRDVEIESLNQLIRDVPRDHDPAHLGRMELLLSRRDRLYGMRTWPIDMPMITRILLYVVIPLAAWSGAAIVEMVISSFLAD